MFKLRNPANPAASTHGGVLEFIAQEGCVHLPAWMMKTLRLNEGDPIRVTGCELPKGKLVKLQAQTVDFLEISDPKAVCVSPQPSYEDINPDCATVLSNACAISQPSHKVTSSKYPIIRSSSAYLSWKLNLAEKGLAWSTLTSRSILRRRLVTWSPSDRNLHPKLRWHQGSTLTPAPPLLGLHDPRLLWLVPLLVEAQSPRVEINGRSSRARVRRLAAARPRARV